jgi:hypothetical protein
VGQEQAPHENGSRPKSEGNGHHQHVGGYRLLRELDTDSLGSIYEAEHPRLHRRVALRTIGTGVARDVSFSRRFLLELRSYTAPSMPRASSDCPGIKTAPAIKSRVINDSSVPTARLPYRGSAVIALAWSDMATKSRPVRAAAAPPTTT